MSTRSKSGESSVQGQILKNQLGRLDFDSICREVSQDIESDREQDLENIDSALEASNVENEYDQELEETREEIQKFGTAVATGQILDEADMDYMEEGGWAVFAYTFNEEGSEAMRNWRGSHDTDKRLRADNSHDRTVENIIESVYGENNPQGETIEESLNQHHDSRKLTAYIEVQEDEYVECDFMRHDSPEDHKYGFEDSEEIQVGEGNLKVPALKELLNEKVKVYTLNEDSKNLQDVQNLLYVAEKRHERGEEGYSMKDLYKHSKNSERGTVDLGEDEEPIENLHRALQDMAVEIDNNLPHTLAEDQYAPSKNYLEAII